MQNSYDVYTGRPWTRHVAKSLWVKSPFSSSFSPPLWFYFLYTFNVLHCSWVEPMFATQITIELFCFISTLHTWIPCSLDNSNPRKPIPIPHLKRFLLRSLPGIPVLDVFCRRPLLEGCKYTYMNTYIIYIYMCVSFYTYIYTCTSMYIYTHVYQFIHLYLFIYIYIYIYICVYVSLM